MEKINKIVILIIPIVLISLISAYIIVSSEKLEEFNKDIFEVESADDDGRTFIVNYNEFMSENENGAWAILQLSSTYSFGVRFNNVTIPKDAIIKDAYVELYSIGTPGHSNPNCMIYCDNVDDSVNFSVYGVLNISGRNYTENYAYWNSTVPYGKWIKTPSITHCVNEVFSRQNWTSGNALSILFVSEGIKGYAAAFQNFENGYPARLYIKWKEQI